MVISSGLQAGSGSIFEGEIAHFLMLLKSFPWRNGGSLVSVTVTAKSLSWSEGVGTVLWCISTSPRRVVQKKYYWNVSFKKTFSFHLCMGDWLAVVFTAFGSSVYLWRWKRGIRRRDILADRLRELKRRGWSYFTICSRNGTMRVYRKIIGVKRNYMELVVFLFAIFTDLIPLGWISKIIGINRSE